MDTNASTPSARRTLRKRIRAGDHDAFGELFDAYARAVYNHAYRLTGEWTTAEEVVSLTFLDAWRLREKLDVDGGSLRPWLLGIATNVMRNTRRAARRHAAAVARLPRGEEPGDFADEVEGRMDAAARLALVRVALAKLRRPERERLALCVWGGLDYAAAEALGVPRWPPRARTGTAPSAATSSCTSRTRPSRAEPPRPGRAARPRNGRRAGCPWTAADRACAASPVAAI
ncbi:RNA polymerase sigma factor [Streptomyces sp. B21-102]|uniref:RNA polymerase sigma factor n=1 Tax=Streptomyces sp. B21-102 TaxID=3039416 RepID=UPI003FA7919B